MIVLHLVLIVVLAPSPFSLQFNGNFSLKPRLRKTRDINFEDLTFYYYYEDEPDEAKTSKGCEDGYYRQRQQKICRPICKKPCVHGTCTGPGKCSCNNGYESDPDDKYRCLPICGIGKQRSLLNKEECEPAMCSKECINSLCRGPETCHCMRGYKKDPSNSYVCTPKCTEASCKNGTCTAEGECTCKQGYAKNAQEHCSPLCQPTCVNSTCTEPNVCTCYAGYRNINKYQCECPQENRIIDEICKPLNICNVICWDGRCSIAEKCYYCPAEREDVCDLIETSDEREKCFNSTFCLINCKCSNEVCNCEKTSTVSTTTTTTTTTTTPFIHPYSSPVPDVRTYSDSSDPAAMGMQNNFSSTTVVGVGAVAVVVLGVAIAAGIIIRKRKRKSGSQIVQNDVYRMQNSPQTIDIENEIYEETNEYEEISEKK